MIAASVEFYWGVAVIGALLLVACVVTSRVEKTLPPLAQPCLPLLGNALHYKDHPDKFLISCAHKLGGIFRINLAGMQTCILSSRSGMKQFAFAPKNVLSSREAVADFGFRYTLGDLNVFEGTDMHRLIVKNRLTSPNDVAASVDATAKSVLETLREELPQRHNKVKDVFSLSRRLFLAVVIKDFIGAEVLQRYNALPNSGGDLVSEFMIFQDKVEEATAQAAVMPIWLSWPLYLRGCEQRRDRIVKYLSAAIQLAWADVDAGVLSERLLGVWASETRHMPRFSRTSEGAIEQGTGYSARETAELCCGLLFAAHKNPSICAAQSIMFMMEKESYLQRAIDEVSSIDNKKSFNEEMEKCTFISDVISETLRVTAHSIGAVRKVVDQSGWTVTIPHDETDTAKGSTTYTLPFGSYVGVSHIIPHHDPDRWGADCDIFNPDRPDLQEKCRDDLLFTAFSHGIHKCPGRNVVLMLMKVVIIQLLKHYKVSLYEPHSGQKEPIPPLCFERATLAQRKGPCTLYINIRQ